MSIIFKYPSAYCWFNVDAFGDFAYDFAEATSRNFDSRKDVCVDTYQYHSMKGATKGDLEA